MQDSAGCHALTAQRGEHAERSRNFRHGHPPKGVRPWHPELSRARREGISTETTCADSGSIARKAHRRPRPSLAPRMHKATVTGTRPTRRSSTHQVAGPESAAVRLAGPLRRLPRRRCTGSLRTDPGRVEPVPERVRAAESSGDTCPRTVGSRKSRGHRRDRKLRHHPAHNDTCPVRKRSDRSAASQSTGCAKRGQTCVESRKPALTDESYHAQQPEAIRFLAARQSPIAQAPAQQLPLDERHCRPKLFNSVEIRQIDADERPLAGVERQVFDLPGFVSVRH